MWIRSLLNAVNHSNVPEITGSLSGSSVHRAAAAPVFTVWVVDLGHRLVAVVVKH